MRPPKKIKWQWSKDGKGWKTEQGYVVLRVYPYHKQWWYTITIFGHGPRGGKWGYCWEYGAAMRISKLYSSAKVAKTACECEIQIDVNEAFNQFGENLLVENGE